MAKLTREEHLQMAECLRRAKRHLCTGKDSEFGDKEMFVCLAAQRTKMPSKVKENIFKWIRKQTDGYGTITSWLRTEHRLDLRWEMSQKYRHNWVNHMIKILES